MKWLVLLCTSLFVAPSGAETDPNTGRFSYAVNNPFVDDTLGRIALYLIRENQREGLAYLSPEVEAGIVGYQLRLFDDGNQLVDEKDKMSVRRFTVPAMPDSTLPDGYWRNEYVEYVDEGLNGIDENDHYFLNGRRYDLYGEDLTALAQHQTQVETAINTFIQKVDYQATLRDLGSRSQLSIRKGSAFEDGSLPAQVVFGLDLSYVFEPIERDGRVLPTESMIEQIRQRIGLVYSATLGYTDLTGYRLRDLADQTALIQRTYDPAEKRLIELIVDSLFDPDGDGLIEAQNISNGYTRFRELHQELSDNARSQNRRIVLPSEKIERLRQEYEAVRSEPFRL